MDRVELYTLRGWLVTKVAIGLGLVAIGVSVTFGSPPQGDTSFTAAEWLQVQRVAAVVTLLLCLPLAAALEALIWRSPVVIIDQQGVTLRGNFIPWADYRGMSTTTTRVNFIKVATTLKVLTHSRRFLFWRSRSLEHSWMPAGGRKRVAEEIARAAARFAGDGADKAPEQSVVVPRRNVVGALRTAGASRTARPSARPAVA
ncbi:MAG: hypothetical protein AAFP28_12705 [Pseudomonadota bacterium]